MRASSHVHAFNALAGGVVIVYATGTGFTTERLLADKHHPSLKGHVMIAALLLRQVYPFLTAADVEPDHASNLLPAATRSRSDGYGNRYPRSHLNPNPNLPPAALSSRSEKGYGDRSHAHVSEDGSIVSPAAARQPVPKAVFSHPSPNPNPNPNLKDGGGAPALLGS